MLVSGSDQVRNCGRLVETRKKRKKRRPGAVCEGASQSAHTRRGHPHRPATYATAKLSQHHPKPAPTPPAKKNATIKASCGRTTPKPYLEQVQEARPLRKQQYSVPLGHQFGQQDPQPLHLGGGEERLLGQTQVLQAVVPGADLVQVEVGVARHLLDHLNEGKRVRTREDEGGRGGFGSARNAQNQKKSDRTNARKECSRAKLNHVDGRTRSYRKGMAASSETLHCKICVAG